MPPLFSKTEIETAQRVLGIKLQQQQTHLNHPGKRIEDRIVSIHKPYVRTIIRGKEAKAV